MLFTISILILTASAFVAVGLSARKAPMFAAAAALLVAVAGIQSYSSYKELLGVPVSISWSEAPEVMTVIFFRIDGTESITLWIEPNRLVVLPYNEMAEGALEGERETMGSGLPSTFRKSGKGGGNSQGEGGSEGDGDGDGGGEDDDEGGESSGWPYELKSRGGQALPGTLPPKR